MTLVRVLCVDDEPQVLHGLGLLLRRGYEVVPARNGIEGLAALRDAGPFAVILSDMRMPGMSGAEFLARARELAPDTTRMLLTGHADIQAAVAAVNRGQIFRFLTKPCPPDELRAAFDVAARQYELVTAERVLLGQTLLGSIKTLTDILSMTSPLVFGKATRIRNQVSELAERLSVPDRWALEAAAMLSQLGCITLPDELVARHYAGEELSPQEQVLVGRIPQLTDSLLANIPRLEPVRELLARGAIPATHAGRRVTPGHSLTTEASILRVAIDFDELETRGASTGLALDTMSGRTGQYLAEVLAEFIVGKGAAQARRRVREIPLRGLAEGMVLVEDLRARNGVLLVARGFKVTAGFVERTRNFDKGYVREPIKVLVGVTPASPPQSS